VPEEAIGIPDNSLDTDQATSYLVIPLLIKLIYKSILSINIPSPAMTTNASATDRTDKAATAVTVGANVATVRGGSLKAKTSPE
jgi:hypothetical protein